MGIQSYDDLMKTSETTLLLSCISHTLSNDYRELMASINNLEISIADCEDKGIPCDKKKELLSKYLDNKNYYEGLADTQRKRTQKKQKRQKIETEQAKDANSQSQSEEYMLPSVVTFCLGIFLSLFVIISICVAYANR